MDTKPRRTATETQAEVMTPRTELTLIHSVGEWAEQNFGIQRHPEYGVLEEIGEACHCILKRIQKIRGMADEDKFKAELGDAFADAIIFLADWCHLNNAYFQFKIVQRMQPADINERLVIQHILQATSVLFSIATENQMLPDTRESNVIGSNAAQRVVEGLTYWAAFYEMDLAFLVASTWVKVQKRNWKKNKETGGE